MSNEQEILNQYVETLLPQMIEPGYAQPGTEVTAAYRMGWNSCIEEIINKIDELDN